MKFYQQKDHRHNFRPCPHSHNYQTQSPSSQQEDRLNEAHHSPHFHKISEYESSPSPLAKDELCPLHSRNQDEPIWEHLYNEGMKSQRQLREIYLNNLNKIDQECTFQPFLQGSKRYILPSTSTFLERVNAWKEHKIEKMVREKEELTQKDLKECTFTPKIKKNYPKAPCQSGEAELKRLQMHQQARLSASKISNPYYSPLKSARSIGRCGNSRITVNAGQKKGKIEMDEVKKMLRKQLRKINL